MDLTPLIRAWMNINKVTDKECKFLIKAVELVPIADINASAFNTLSGLLEAMRGES